MLADLLERLDASQKGKESETSAPEVAASPSLLDYASSHPATSERLEYLRGR